MAQSILINSDWKFCLGDAADAHEPAFDDASWRLLNLPHDWSIEGPFSAEWASATGYLPGGIGWYRKTIDAQAVNSGNIVSLDFDGVYCNSDVWINGHHVSKRPNGFISFRADVTPHWKTDSPNVVAVRVDHTHFGDCRWYTGSGINRNVYLVTQNKTHLDQWSVFAQTTSVTADEARIALEASVTNGSDTAVNAEVHWTILDAAGSPVGCARDCQPVDAGVASPRSATLTIERPNLWDVDSPYLYTLRTEVIVDGAVVDAESCAVGIRTFEFDADTGFTLNGRSMKLKGVCTHDDAGALGTAVPPAVWERRLATLKAGGANAIRLAHNPHMPEFYDICDRLGFLVQDEAFDEWELGKNKWIAGWNVGKPGKDGYSAHFAEWAEIDLRDMVLRDRNHPCVIMWSIGNEIDYPNDPYSHEILDHGTNPQMYGRGFQPSLPHSSRLGEVARDLVAIVKRYDTSRPVTAAISAALISNETGFCDALDVVGYNYQEGRYECDHAKYPGRVLYGSENGMHWGQWEAVANNPYISAQFLWTGIDYLGEAGSWPTRSNGAGLLDLAGLPKPEYFYRQSIWSDEPMVFIGTRDVPQGEEATHLWSHKRAEPVWKGETDKPIRVICFSNCDSVELFLNGSSLGSKEMSDAQGHVLFWDIPYSDGTLKARGTVGGGVSASAALKTPGAPAQIRIDVDRANIKADGIDLAHIVAHIVDAQGSPVYDASHELTWTVDGPARLLGLESGDHTSHESYQSPSRRAYHGKVLGYVQSTEEGGTVTITVTAEGLEAASVEVRTG